MFMEKLYKSLSVFILLLVLSSATALAQRTVTGKVIDEFNDGLPGVSILVKGTTTGVVTDIEGNYSINVPSEESTLVFSFIGFVSKEEVVGNRSQINITLEESLQGLDEVIVTGYTSERKRDIVGSVSVVNTKTTLQQPSFTLGNMLQGRAAGVTVSGTGAPGAAAKVRIRGFTSFGNNDPLYVIDGVPTDNANALNPQDIESVQVLKDPVSASIYGSRAANGVIVVTTRQGTSGKTNITYDTYVGFQALPNRVFPTMLNTEEYREHLIRAADGAGIPFNSRIFQNGIPRYLVSNMDVNARPGEATNPDFDRYNWDPYSFENTYQIAETSPGTDWHRDAAQNGIIHMHQLGATGGTDKGSYSMGLNYFNSDGVFRETGLQRTTLRANTRFSPKKWITVGENLQLAFTNQFGASGNPNDLSSGLDFNNEGQNPWYLATRAAPFIPLQDIAGNPAGTSIGGAGQTLTAHAVLPRNRDNFFKGLNLFGNVFAQLHLTENLTASTSFGIDQRYGNGGNFTWITPEKAEPIRNNAYSEYFSSYTSWTWTNSLQYNLNIGDKHVIKLFGATEAIFEQGRFLSASRRDYDFNDPDFRSINTGKNLPQNSGAPGTPRTLSSIFGKAEYQLMDRYLFSATIRRDEASVFGPDFRVGIFPAFGFGWRISEESFMQSATMFDELKLRGGWGQMGSQRNVSANNAYSFFGAGLFSTAYDISGTNGIPPIGYRPSVVGNPSTKWESAEMINVGLDGSMFGGRLDFTVEYFNNTTNDLLVDRQRNGLEPNVGQPRINVGTMVNKGIDGSLNTRGRLGKDWSYNVGMTFTHYRNEAVKIDAEGSSFLLFGAGRLGNVQRIEAGRPLASFWGWQVDGIFQTEEEVTAHADMPYKRVGSWKIRDINGDGVIDGDDQTFIGNPIPKFQMGMDIGFNYKNWDFQTFLFWNQGNQIYNYTKWSTHLRGFEGGYSADVLYDTWTPENRGASMPILNANDTFSGAISNSWYVEDGSFLRVRQMQLGYTFPMAQIARLGMYRARVYVQGQNMFTFTNYSGPDPDIGILGNSELQMGVDQFRTPAPRTIIVGINVGF
jgi:TonB-dependent starch-binding outer membrane protein SusC